MRPERGESWLLESWRIFTTGFMFIFAQELLCKRRRSTIKFCDKIFKSYFLKIRMGSETECLGINIRCVISSFFKGVLRGKESQLLITATPMDVPCCWPGKSLCNTEQNQNHVVNESSNARLARRKLLAWQLKWLKTDKFIRACLQ